MHSIQLEAHFPTNLDVLMDSVEAFMIYRAIKRAKGNKTKAAKLLGISYGSLRYRLSKLRMER